MPYYQYKCRHCGQSFEKKLPMSQAHSPQNCPHCRHADTRKLLTNFAVSSGSGGATTAAPRFT